MFEQYKVKRNHQRLLEEIRLGEVNIAAAITTNHGYVFDVILCNDWRNNYISYVTLTDVLAAGTTVAKLSDIKKLERAAKQAPQPTVSWNALYGKVTVLNTSNGINYDEVILIATSKSGGPDLYLHRESLHDDDSIRVYYMVGDSWRFKTVSKEIYPWFYVDYDFIEDPAILRNPLFTYYNWMGNRVTDKSLIPKPEEGSLDSILALIKQLGKEYDLLTQEDKLTANKAFAEFLNKSIEIMIRAKT